jgi:hypothetical protein
MNKDLLPSRRSKHTKQNSQNNAVVIEEDVNSSNNDFVACQSNRIKELNKDKIQIHQNKVTNSKSN